MGEEMAVRAPACRAAAFPCQSPTTVSRGRAYICGQMGKLRPRGRKCTVQGQAASKWQNPETGLCFKARVLETQEKGLSQAWFPPLCRTGCFLL